MIFFTKRILVFLMALAGLAWVNCPWAATHLPAGAPPTVEEFPLYPIIRPNVAFWTDIFTKYTRADGVIHDVRDLSIIYGQVPLNPAKTRQAAEQNRKTKKKAIKTYRAVLLKLAQGDKPASPLEKKVAALFGPNPKSGRFKQAAHNLRIQTGLKEQFKAGIVRSGAMIDEFKGILRSYGLPQDLVYLPCVESSFDPAAYSKFGAAGIWQFTRSTGKLYMDIGYVVDERRDPIIATHGAAQLLKKNFAALKSWPLAITAYNHGLAGMKRAQKHGTYAGIYAHYRSRSFKFASRNFYSEFLAARLVAKNHTRYFGKITLDRPAAHTRLKTKGFIPAGPLADGLDLDIQAIKSLNPALRKPVFDGRKHIPKGYELRLPRKISARTAEKVAATLYTSRQKPSRFHRVRKGDTAGRIAQTHKVSLQDLIVANGLDRRATIYIGQTLKIPSYGQARPAAASIAAKKDSPNPPPSPAPIKKKRSAPRKPHPIPAQPPAAPARADQPVVTADLKIKTTLRDSTGPMGIIHVAPGETLGHYADWLGIATGRIRRVNRLPFGRAISLGQTIRLPLPPSGLDDFEEKRYEFHQEILEDFFDSFFISGIENYTVKSGDTIWDLCENQLEIPLWLLEKYNPAMDINHLVPGQTLVFPRISPNGSHPRPMDSDFHI